MGLKYSSKRLLQQPMYKLTTHLKQTLKSAGFWHQQVPKYLKRNLLSPSKMLKFIYAWTESTVRTIVLRQRNVWGLRH